MLQYGPSASPPQRTSDPAHASPTAKPARRGATMLDVLLRLWVKVWDGVDGWVSAMSVLVLTSSLDS